MREIRERNVSANSIKRIRDESSSFEGRMRLVIMLRYLYALCRLEIPETKWKAVFERDS